ncbi:MAG: aspartate kinase [Bdellovibrionales bacterium]|nr:aspartate kinase [Bdellovibrionales bacterium]
MEFRDRIIVKKFGGTSVGSIERIEHVAALVARERAQGRLPVVVASAMSGETNRLVALGNQIDPSYRGPAYDMLVASGEQVSIALIVIALAKLGVPAKPLLAYQLGIETDSVYSKARIKSIRTKELEATLVAGVVPVIAGFQGVDEEYNITTLGRGGSDTSAVAVAAALQLGACEIYTDVPAVFSADPRLVPKAREIPRLSFEEMMEMASLGSKVLHVRSVEIGAKHGVRIHVRHTFQDREGTWIVPEGEIMENPVVSAVTHDAATVVFKLAPIPGETAFIAKLFSVLSEKGVSVDIISQSQLERGYRLAFSVTAEDEPLVKNVLAAFLPSEVKVETLNDVAKISTVGVGMRNHPGVAARFFSVLADKGIQVQLVTTSEIKISAIIDRDRLDDAARALHSEFSLDI